ncbi:MAG: DsbA family protein [Acidimicrobiia bacterium]
MNIDFYFDPSCPWCWITSRWLCEVSTERDLNINWIGFSLAMKNDELTGNDTTGHLEAHTTSHQVLRIIEAIAKAENIDRGLLYTEFGYAYHLNSKLDDDNFIEKVIEKLNLDPKYIEQGNNKELDVSLQSNINQAISIVGDDVGVPLIIFENEKGEKQGFFGPVLSKLPEKELGLELFDGLAKFAACSEFYELKRTRSGRSKVKTTNRLFNDVDE